MSSSDSSLLTAKQKVTSLLNWVRRDFYLPLVLVPLLFACSVYMGMEYGVDKVGPDITLKYEVKRAMEVVHPSLLFCFLCIASLCWKRFGSASFRWTAITAAALFMRELHFAGSDIIVYTTLIVLWTLAWRNPKHIVDLSSHRLGSSFFVMGFFSYFCSESLDRKVFGRFFKIYLNDYEYNIPHSATMEECLESSGGVFLVLSALVLFVHWRRRMGIESELTNR